MSRLRNRMVKAEFWTDPELLRWPLPKRIFYQGLWALAEDSGCLEDDAFGWKLQLFPSPADSDITLEALTAWRDELVEAGKLVPYEVGGKRYLYLPTFHRHEMTRNPQRPDLPLPPWVEVIDKDGASKDGKRWLRCRYEVHEDLLSKHLGVCTESVPSLYGHSTESVRGPQSRPVQTRPDQSLTPTPPIIPPKIGGESDLSTADDVCGGDGHGELVLVGEIVEEGEVRQDCEPSFDAFWSAYPRKEAKKPARALWAKMRPRDCERAIQVAEVMGRLVAAGMQDRQYVPQPTTWLRQERWHDWDEGPPAGWGLDESAVNVREQAVMAEAIADLEAQGVFGKDGHAGSRSGTGLAAYPGDMAAG